MGYFANFQPHRVNFSLDQAFKAIELRQRAEQTKINKEIVKEQGKQAQMAMLGRMNLTAIAPDPYNRGEGVFPVDWKTPEMREVAKSTYGTEDYTGTGLAVDGTIVALSPMAYEKMKADLETEQTAAEMNRARTDYWKAGGGRQDQSTTDEEQALIELRKIRNDWYKGRSTEEKREFDPRTGRMVMTEGETVWDEQLYKRLKPSIDDVRNDAERGGYIDKIPPYLFDLPFEGRSRSAPTVQAPQVEPSGVGQFPTNRPLGVYSDKIKYREESFGPDDVENFLFGSGRR